MGKHPLQAKTFPPVLPDSAPAKALNCANPADPPETHHAFTANFMAFNAINPLPRTLYATPT
jgi:hypothetical protein